MGAERQPAFDVSVILPAWRAGDWIARAVASIAPAAGPLRVEIVIGADDATDYLAILAGEGLSGSHIVQCRTARPASGPAAARNAAARMARAPLLACLDADDAFAPRRLERLAGPARAHGAATGPTIEIAPDGTPGRTARPAAGRTRLAIEDICRPRMPIFPVFRKALLGPGWPDIAFAEDMVFNAGLLARAGAYAFVEGADYRYHLRPGSLTHGPEAMARARRGYEQILALLETVPWPAPMVRAVRETILEDRRNLERARRGGHADEAGAAQSWREAVR